MDERLEKAFQTANYMASLSGQRRAALEEFNQNIVYYHQGSTFTVSRDLLVFIKMVIDLEQSEITVLDDNQVPCRIQDVKKFFDNILNLYISSTNAYLAKYSEIKSKRKIEALVDL